MSFLLTSCDNASSASPWPLINPLMAKVLYDLVDTPVFGSMFAILIWTEPKSFAANILFVQEL